MRISESRWYKNKGSQIILQKILETSEFKEALQVIFEKNTPTLVKGEHALTNNALENSFQVGLQSFTRELELLAHPTQRLLIEAGVKDLPSLGRPWGHFDTEKTSFPSD